MSGFSQAQAEQIKQVGSYLQQQRQQQSLSLEAVADATFIRLTILEALENGTVESLPEPIYVRGFIRRYSDILQVDGEALIQQIDSVPEITAKEIFPDSFTENVPLMSESSVPVETGKSREISEKNNEYITDNYPQEESKQEASFMSLIPPWAYLLVIATVVGFAAFYWLSQSPTSQTAPDSSSPTVSPTTKASPSATAEAELETPVVTSPSPSPSPSPPASPSPGETARLSATVITTGDSWLQVQVDGEVVYEGTLTQGETKSWSAEKALIVKAGNAGVVKLSVNQATAKLMGNMGEVKEVVVSKNNN